ncbi:MAG: histidine kinase [Candidatus Latescibacteria bacterium]|nr:histidine kinase [Candidatus Latescibacterota bacterium]
MTLHRKFILYLVLIHLAFAASAAFLMENRAFLLAVEAFFLLSLVFGVRLLRALFSPLDLIRTGTELIDESDFTCRFREVGQPEADRLIQVYNRMIDHLREERVRLQEQHYFLDRLLRASPSGILTFDFDEAIATANPSAERTLQAPAESLTGQKLSVLHTPFADALGHLKVGESRVIPLQGRQRVKCQRSQFLDRGFPRSFILMEELTEELRQSEKAAYEKLIRLMSHEVNNSLGAAGSLLHSCLNYRDQLRDEDRRDFETALQVAISRTDHLNAFMKSFADVVRLPPPELRLCDVEQLLKDIAFLMSAECRSRRIAWAWDIREPLGPILMDKNQMEQVFLNILKNAVEAIGEGGGITIRGGKKGGRRFIAVEDTGCGIAPEVRSNLFTPFFSTKPNGQGIGLTLVQEILSRHHFDFSLDGQPGGPTQFTIYF